MVKPTQEPSDAPQSRERDRPWRGVRVRCGRMKARPAPAPVLALLVLFAVVPSPVDAGDTGAGTGAGGPMRPASVDGRADTSPLRVVRMSDAVPVEPVGSRIDASAAPPGPAAGTDEACAVYMLVSGTTLDRERMAAYQRALSASGLYASVGGRYVNQPRPIEVLEGEPSPDFVSLIVRFPDLGAAREFWNSATYQNEIRPLRLAPPAGDYTVTLYRSASADPDAQRCD